ncbi:MAG TPA: hypothetical protein VE685_09215, partial [Thermoanaerobaculia bacterium]|nr:hypothetical protein [Thermoanaerobaculia bacterium]
MRRLGPILLLALWAVACNGGEPSSGKPSRGPAAGARSPAAPAGKGREPKILVELRRGRNPQEVVLIGRGGALLGPAGGPLSRTVFSSRERAEDLRFFFRRYAPFRMPVPGGELVFRGTGRVRAGAAERRMIAEWARLVAVEAAGRAESAVYGLVLAWHRGGAPGICDEVSVYLTGEVRASSCSWNEEVRGRLAPENLPRLYDWFDRLAPFQTGGGEADLAGGTESRLIFAGRGREAASDAEIAAIQAFTPALFRELAARRPGAPFPPAGGTPAAQRPDGAKPAGPPPPAPPRLLLPPDRPVGPTGPKPGTEVVLEFPEEPPPVPVR